MEDFTLQKKEKDGTEPLSQGKKTWETPKLVEEDYQRTGSGTTPPGFDGLYYS